MHGLKKSIHEPTGKFIVRSIYKFDSDVERVSKLSGNEEHDTKNIGKVKWEEEKVARIF